jgi:DNA replication protein DnaC
MAVKIRLQRHGKKNFAFFHIVVADTRAPRDGRFIEQLGSYNPNTNPATIILDGEKALKWLNVGAQPTLVARRILSYEGVLLRKHLDGGIAKGALTQEQADAKWNAWKAERDAKIAAKKAGLVKDAAEKAKVALEAEKKVNAERAEALAKKAEELAEAQRKAAEERQRRMERIKRRKAQGLQDRYLYDYTFANDNGQKPLMDKARAYVENWKEAYKSNIGLLLFGDVGTGKSFFAGCIANALLDRDVPVLMTNFPTILNRLTGMFSEDRSEFIASFDEYDLLIIDDLGVERSTEYAMEQMFFVIDSRYRSRRPMIITTNLKLSELKNPPDLAHARIYDRILERCAPILFDGKNFREENAGATRQTAKDIVNSKQD